MILPLKIEHRYTRVPYVTYALLAANVLVFVLTWRRGSAIERFALDTEHFTPLQLLTSGFLHIGPIHLIGNMLFLSVYGRYVEDRLGPARFLGVYGLSELGSDLAYLAADEGRSVGASGAISGLMGFVIVAARWVEVRFVWSWGPYVRTGSVTAFWLVGSWIGMQLLFLSAGLEGSAYSAHFGGLITGGAIAAVLRSPRLKGTRWWVDPAPPEGVQAAIRRLRRAAGRREASTSPGFPIRIVSLDRVESRVAVIKRLMVRCGLEPEDAKARLDAVAPGAPAEVLVPSAETALALASELRALGAVVETSAPRAVAT